jgi:type IV pilus assembly protein PilN
VILINLLPHRELARKRRLDFFYLSLGASVLVGGLICGGIYSGYQTQIYAQQARNTHLKSAITELESKIKDIAGLQQEIAALRARQTAVEDLQGDRNLPVYLLSELVKQLPDGVYINSMRQENQTVTLTGVAQSNERVSELLRNLANNSLWLTKPELIEITASSIALNTREQRRVSNFSMRVALKKASDQSVMPVVAGASAAVAGVSPIQP